MINFILKVERATTIVLTAFALLFGCILISFIEKELNLDGYKWFFMTTSFSYGYLLIRFVVETRFKQ